MTIPTEEQVKATIKEWASMMKVADWQIDFAFVNHLELKETTGKEGNVASCRRNRLLKQALIEIDPDHYDTKKDWEQTLAHEMYHVVTDDFHYHASCCLDFSPEEAHDTFENQINMYYERLVDDLAKGFVSALRRCPPCPGPPTTN